ncbi:MULTISPECIES: tyrosine-type recombinase/integrase [Oligella]|uniref:tyrosine-type recombinase/integrase n=1 Tax=Oligella TaxID=90243 RepID=UPI00352DB358
MALAQDELTTFFKRLEEQPADLLSKLGLIFLIITFVRSTSLRTMEWEDVNFKKKEWLIPKEKFKGKKIDLVVPLSDWAIEILETLYENSRLKQGYIFHQQRNVYKPMSENTLTALMWRMGYKDIATPHGFRSLATDVLNENNYKPDVIERQMGHVEKNSVRRAYHRAEYLEERKEMMQWYSDWIREKYRKAGQSL